jgi:F-type H+-transporting ATPase subunit b
VKRLAAGVIMALGLAALGPAQEHGQASEKAGHGEKAEHEGGHEGAKDLGAWKWANFAILAAGLGYLLTKQVGPYFAAQSLAIRKGIEDAKTLSADAEKRAAAMEARLANLGAEVEALRKSAKEEANREGDRIRQETQQELAKVRANADHELNSALKAAQAELKHYSGQLAIDLARNKVRERMTAADQDALVRGFVADLARRPSLEKGPAQ